METVYIIESYLDMIRHNRMTNLNLVYFDQCYKYGWRKKNSFNYTNSQLRLHAYDCICTKTLDTWLMGMVWKAFHLYCVSFFLSLYSLFAFRHRAWNRSSCSDRNLNEHWIEAFRNGNERIQSRFRCRCHRRYTLFVSCAMKNNC